jgi:hypothetical protein
MSEDIGYMDKHFGLAGIEAETQNADTPSQSNQETQIQGNQGEDSISGESSESSQDTSTATGNDSVSGGSGEDSQSQQNKGQEAVGGSNPGDLVVDGVTYKAGKERRLYQEAHNAKSELGFTKTLLHNERQKVKGLSDKIEAINQASTALGVADPTEVQDALRLYKDLLTDPVRVLAKLIAEAKALGHNIEGIGPTVDTSAIKSLLDERLPQNQQKSSQDTQEIDQEVIDFVTAYPESVIHEEVIASIIEREAQQGRSVSLVETWLALKTALQDQGFDISRHLQPQVEAKKAQRIQTPAKQPQNNSTPKILNGVGITPANSQPFDLSGIEDQADSFDDAIILGMRDAGLDYKR